MTTAEKIHRINQVLRDYFAKHKSGSPVPAKQFMTAFIQAGIFTGDSKEGLPIRTLLRKLDANKQLQHIPYVIAERKQQNTNWFFGPASQARVIAAKPKGDSAVRKTISKTKTSKPRSHSDECYILDLCDEVLHLNSVRQHRFYFLLGDPNSTGRCARLPVDGWYESLNLVIEYNERQHTEAVKIFDRRITVSGKTRGEQRADYDKRKLRVLPEHGIQMLVLSYFDFQHDANKRLCRDRDSDIRILQHKLKPFLTKPEPKAI
jgi:hypothetical protein